ncbi:unnamed protein product [Plutella xylostella]|uniref:(diamondback moth) hypothetical protein n=1 Tax=Plutella xylostella TaxID=51655 RepID=A0A8S4FXM7_PLUXY|nr:unnamed protein product [Plutella xylostella]
MDKPVTVPAPGQPEPAVSQEPEKKGFSNILDMGMGMPAIPLPPSAMVQPQHSNQDRTFISIPEYIENPENFQDETFKTFDYTEHTIRRAFISKVYSLVLGQLLVTGAFIAWFLFDHTTRLYVHRNSWVMLTALAMYAVSFCCILCCKSPRRRVPYNYLFLLAFTLGLSLLVATVTSMYEVGTVLLAVGVTGVIVLGLTLFAFQTKYDFTTLNGSLFVMFLTVITFGIIAAIMQSQLLKLLYSALGVLLFGIYLVYDTQMIIGGKHRYKISPEEYVFAALTIYLDIMNIFLRMLRLLRA